MFDEVIALESNIGSSETERGTRHTQDAGVNAHSCENNTPLQKVAEGPWQSLGGYFDYSEWNARERFMELDKAIACAQYPREREVRPDTQNTYASSVRVVTAAFTAFRLNDSAHPVAFLTRIGTHIDASDEMIKFVVGAETDYLRCLIDVPSL